MNNTDDSIFSPAHYTHGGIETIDYIEAKGLDKSYNLGNVIKYVSRAGVKSPDAIQDLKKALWYLEREISRREGAQCRTR